MIGTTLGHYQILEKLGEGGMGVVYKARDVLLNRTAALKFLPPDSADAGDKRRRFVQEAQAASALNHPNIVTIYEVGAADGHDFIAMELVQGQTLDQAIARKPLTIDRALACAIQIADALTAAHAAGLVHRDLKPSNVMVGDSGRVKVLDFGLAKLVAGPFNSSDATQTVVTQTSKTADGTIFGTVAYMSPEQAEGKPVDHRSDIFAFGAVLHEMLTGRRAFAGESTAATLAAILTAEPALATELPGVPHELTKIVARCLRKQPERRWQSIADVKIALEELQQDLQNGRLTGPAANAPVARRGWTSIIAASAIAAALGGFAVWSLRPAPSTPDLWQISRLTSESGVGLLPAISRDGRLVAYVSDRAASDSVDLWVQQVDGGDPVQLTRNLGFCRDPAFSPDGSRIIVTCGSDRAGVYIVPTLGGLPKQVAEGDWPRFSPDGSKISYVRRSADGSRQSIWVASADGGNATELQPHKPFNSAPIWRPDGKGLVIVAFDEQDKQNPFDWFFVPADGGPLVRTGALERLRGRGFGAGRYLTLTNDGFLFTLGNIESSNIYRLPFDAEFQKAIGAPIPVVVGAGFSFAPSASADGHRVAFSVGTNLSNVIWRAALDATGKVTGSPLRIAGGIGPMTVPSPSRDGRRIAYHGGSRQAPEIRVRDLESGNDIRLAEAKEWSYLVLSPDGTTVAFSSDERPNSGIYTVPTAGGVPKRVCSDCGRPVEWIDNQTKLLADNLGANRRDIHVVDVTTGRTTPLVQHPEVQLTMPRLSPDGRTLAFTMLRPGRARRIYLARFTGSVIPESEWSVVVEGSDLDRQPFWSPNGDALYFISDRDGSRCIWAQRVDASTRRPAGEAFAVHHMHEFRYNLSDLDPASIGLSLAAGQIFYASADLRSNIWLAERQATPSPR